MYQKRETFKYKFVPDKGMANWEEVERFDINNREVREPLRYPYDNLPVIELRTPPHFVIVNTGAKLRNKYGHNSLDLDALKTDFPHLNPTNYRTLKRIHDIYRTWVTSAPANDWLVDFVPLDKGSDDQGYSDADDPGDGEFEPSGSHRRAAEKLKDSPASGSGPAPSNPQQRQLHPESGGPVMQLEQCHAPLQETKDASVKAAKTSNTDSTEDSSQERKRNTTFYLIYGCGNGPMVFITRRTRTTPTRRVLLWKSDPPRWETLWITVYRVSKTSLPASTLIQNRALLCNNPLLRGPSTLTISACTFASRSVTL